MDDLSSPPYVVHVRQSLFTTSFLEVLATDRPIAPGAYDHAIIRLDEKKRVWLLLETRNQILGHLAINCPLSEMEMQGMFI